MATEAPVAKDGSRESGMNACVLWPLIDRCRQVLSDRLLAVLAEASSCLVRRASGRARGSIIITRDNNTILQIETIQNNVDA